MAPIISDNIGRRSQIAKINTTNGGTKLKDVGSDIPKNPQFNRLSIDNENKQKFYVGIIYTNKAANNDFNHGQKLASLKHQAVYRSK
ncbi:hypothetical protein GCM10009332_27480 [Shewanella gelidii]|uniref:Uncharacterized protein n=1 Tax=Shewanella gelidii TaxID=1642821 RepID=A0A917JXD0_9GAMM|nr:hypothetical protein GCM10009332_27480 [Shewanella gelidii]